MSDITSSSYMSLSEFMPFDESVPSDEDQELATAIDTCLVGLEEYIIDCAKRIDVGDINCLNMASVASALHVLKLYEEPDA